MKPALMRLATVALLAVATAAQKEHSQNAAAREDLKASVDGLLFAVNLDEQHAVTDVDQARFKRNVTVAVPVVKQNVSFTVDDVWMPGPLFSPVGLGIFAFFCCSIICAVGVVACYFLNKEGWPSPTPCAVRAWPDSAYVPVGDPNRTFWEAEASLALTAPWVAAAVALVLRLSPLGEAAVGILQPILALPLVLRACRLDWCWLPLAWDNTEGLVGKALLPMGFVMSKLDVLDLVSDGLALAAGLTVPPEVKDRWAGGFLVPDAARSALAIIGPGGGLAAALAYATVVQWAFAVGALGDKQSRFAARLSGLGLAASATQAKEIENSDMDAPLALSRQQGQRQAWAGAVAYAFCESAPQLVLQTTLLAARGERLLHQPVVAASTLLTATMLAKSGHLILFEWVNTVRRVCGRICSGEGARVKVLGSLLVWLFVPLALLSFAAMAAVKVAGVELCESYTWTLTGGCLPPAGLEI